MPKTCRKEMKSFPAQSNGPRHLRSVIAAVGAMLLPMSSIAFRPDNVSAGELELVPPYCIDTEGFIYGPENSPTQSPRAPVWVAQMGRSFWAMHHYCWGLVNLNRLRSGRADTNNKQGFAKGIVNEYLYVIRNARPDFVLLPEIWVRVGEASLLAGEIGPAMDAYERARRLKPDYWPAYTQWAEFLLRYNKKAEAKALVQTGLQHAPDAVALTELYRRLGGDPATVARAASAAASSAAPAAAGPTPTQASSPAAGSPP